MTNSSQRSPILALLLGLIPGIGQIYAGERIRGLSVLFFVPTMMALAIWRLNVAGVYATGLTAPSAEQVAMAWSMFIFLCTCVGLVYLWSLWDAFSIARGRPLRIRPLIILPLLAFFVVGWDITEINVTRAISRFGELGPRLGQLAWPWDEAFVRGIERTEAFAEITVPCGTGTPNIPEEIPGAPYVEANPLCGEMAGAVQPNGTRNPPGTLLIVRGRGFRPNEAVEAWWQPSTSNAFRIRQGRGTLVVDTDANGEFQVEFNIPNFTFPGGDANTNPNIVSKLIMRQEQEQGELRPSTNLILALEKMVETIFLGLMATIIGIIFALPLGFLAARNIMAGSRLTMVIYSLTRLIMNIVRAIEPLIWAVVAVVWVGLGPFAGTVALALHSIASLGKLYSESIENIDPGPIEAIQATGANWLQVILYAVIPQVIPPFVSFTIYRWDVNIRSSTIIGAVGGGGIGAILIQWIRLSDYDSAGIAVWLIAIVVSVLDYISSQIREQFV